VMAQLLQLLRCWNLHSRSTHIVSSECAEVGLGTKLLRSLGSTVEFCCHHPVLIHAPT
jgi:hypothetical protein